MNEGAAKEALDAASKFAHENILALVKEHLASKEPGGEPGEKTRELSRLCKEVHGPISRLLAESLVQKYAYELLVSPAWEPIPEGIRITVSHRMPLTHEGYQKRWEVKAEVPGLAFWPLANAGYGSASDFTSAENAERWANTLRKALRAADKTPYADMKTAPKDGTAILVLTSDSDTPHAIRWLDDISKPNLFARKAGWYRVWDGTYLEESDIDLWMHYPNDPRSKKKPKSVYGYCPLCGGEGVTRERRPDGNDTCVSGHVYPSRMAVGPA